MPIKRALSPSTNAPGLMAAAAAIYAAVAMILHVVHHQGVIDPQVIVSALAAAAALYTRFVVTPVADPKDGNGKPLVSPRLATGGIVPPSVAGTRESPSPFIRPAEHPMPHDPMGRP